MPPAPSSPDPWSTGVYEQGQRGLLECFDAEHTLTPSLCTEYVIPSEYGLAITKWTSILGETSPPQSILQLPCALIFVSGPRYTPGTDHANNRLSQGYLALRLWRWTTLLWTSKYPMSGDVVLLRHNPDMF